ncbi:Kinesin-like protein Klp10A [Cryptotermes secundus]|uniref:Kinesin-like protein Klp10A n=1 Tax=Cryptotermes secundus TaxID=105785 RepID=A0A2J7QJK5_9NEOP|nr:kinesin-like protein Klp10A [Cryptotermes secundus]PNF28773.1 Kinesin-like protein Klp10A [Cryptotermes secundus]
MKAYINSAIRAIQKLTGTNRTPNRPQYEERVRYREGHVKWSAALDSHLEQQSATTARDVENISHISTAPSVTSGAIRKQRLQQQHKPELISKQRGAGQGQRRNVLKVIERMKKNREQQRQLQAKLKEKELQIMMRQGNPNWEFLNMINQYRSRIVFRPLQESDPVEDHQITVCIRKRPLNKSEFARQEVDVISVPSKDEIIVHQPKVKMDLEKFLENKRFKFDYVFDETCCNELVYKYTAKPLVQTIFEGGMATCFAYGQTGSGKTHTMGGDFRGKTQDCKKGIYAMVAEDVFKFLKSRKYKKLNLAVFASFFEIYDNDIFDLLANKAKVHILEDGDHQVNIVGLTEKVVDSVDEVIELIDRGNTARASGNTSANRNSSRSHAVFQVVLRTTGTDRIHGTFSLIDLADNARAVDMNPPNRQTKMEGAAINTSLIVLKECIRALERKDAHIPFGGSKITLVLRDSFIGEKCKTCMIGTISPGMASCEDSLNTLRYVDRVKEHRATYKQRTTS